MIRFYFADGVPKVRIEWTILNGNTYCAEDFEGADVKVWLVGAGKKIEALFTIGKGYLSVDVPSELNAGVYGIRSIWSFHRYSYWRSEVDQVFAVTDSKDDASPIGGEECVLKVKSASALYSRGGLDNHEVAKIKAYYADKAWFADYAYRLAVEGMNELDDRYVRKDSDVEIDHHVTMKSGFVKGDFDIRGNLRVTGITKVDINGDPVAINVFCGDWVDGSKIANPEMRKGIYLAGELNPFTYQHEIHEVRHRSGRWMCLQHQPVVMNGEAVYHEPKWNSPYWKLVDGNENYNILFQSSRGMSFHRGHVDTEVTPRLMYGNVDISEDVTEQFWSWKRYTDTGETLADKAWSAQHEGVKVLHLTNEDMPQEWNSRNRAIFEVSVTLDDGKEQIIISNYIIA